VELHHWEIYLASQNDFASGGYWVNPGDGNKNYWFLFGVGLVADVSDLHHLLLSAGTCLGAPFCGQFYVAYQLTFGPKAQ
jgi:hypothetical protein